ncbi:transmembrane protein, putative [Bodo saltans]|uniref:Transmembrane protein, putative n=1 Tax=Bodo saltans TaxID=75058 RepID=A0A0S4IWJ4_BODSA|nr:transmembrane protein, putative [Bodo saltans]|eukprot:CUF35020.1 transmembrane protein, putative [Bodo saltans]
MGALTKLQMLLKHMQFIGLLQSIDIPFPKIYINFSSLSNLISLDPSFLQSLDQNFPVFTFRLQFFFIAVALPVIIMMLTLLVFVNFTTIMWMCFSVAGILLLAIRIAGEFNQSFVTGGNITSTEYLVVMIATVVYCVAYRSLGKMFNRWSMVVVLTKNLLSAAMLFAGGCMAGFSTLNLQIMLTASCVNVLCYIYKADRPKGIKFIMLLVVGGACAAGWKEMDISFVGVFPDALIIPGYLIIALGAAGWLQFLMYSNSDEGVGKAFIQARKKIQHILDKSLLALAFFFLSSAFVPVVTSCLQMFVCDRYICPVGTKFNPYLPVDYSKPENVTLGNQYCDPCVFQHGCNFSTAELCPAFNEERLYFHPDTSCDDRVATYYKISAVIVLFVFVIVVSLMYYVIIQTITGQLSSFTMETYNALHKQYERLFQRYLDAKEVTQERDELRRLRSSMIRHNINQAATNPVDDLTWTTVDNMQRRTPLAPMNAANSINSPQQINFGASVNFTTTVRIDGFDSDDDDPFDDKNVARAAAAGMQHQNSLQTPLVASPHSTTSTAKRFGGRGVAAGEGSFSPHDAPGGYIPPAPLKLEQPTLNWRPESGGGGTVPPPQPKRARAGSLLDSLRSSFSPKATLAEQELQDEFKRLDEQEDAERRAKKPEAPSMNDALLKVNAKIEPKASSLYNAYRREFQYFLLVEILHRLALVVVSVFVSPTHAFSAGINLALHAMFFGTILLVRPYVGGLEQLLAVVIALSDTLSAVYATLLWQLPTNSITTSEGMGYAVLVIGVIPVGCGAVWQIVDMRQSLVNPYAKQEEEEQKQREEKTKQEIQDLQEQIDNADLFGLSKRQVEELEKKVEGLKAPAETAETKLTDDLNASTKRSILRFFVLGSIPLLLVALGLCVYATLNDPGTEFYNGSDLVTRTKQVVLADRDSWEDFVSDCCCFVSLEPMSGFNITERWACAPLTSTTLASNTSAALSSASDSGGLLTSAVLTVSRNRQSQVGSDGVPIRGVCQRAFALASCTVHVSDTIVSLDCPESELESANITTYAERILW